MKTKPKTARLAILAGILLLASAGWYGAGPGGWFSSAEEGALEGAKVARGPMRISVVQRGNLKSKDSERLLCQVLGHTTVLSLIPEGTFVKKGDLIARLDVSAMEDRKVTQEVSVQNAEAQLTKAQQNLEIQRSQNLSDIARAEQTLDFSNRDLKKYEEGDWPQQKKQADEAIVLAEEELAQSKNRLDWSTRLEEKGFLTRTELEQDKLSYERAKITKEQSIRNKTLLEEYDYPKELARLKGAVEEAQREKERVNLQARARIVDYEAAVRTSDAKLKLERETLNKILDQIVKGKIFAPVAGMVVHGRIEGRYGEGEPIQEGSDVRERQEIATIPNSEGMIVEAKLHETVLKKVHKDEPCEITIDALPGQTFHGHVNSVALLPDKGSWFSNPNQRVYRTEISIDDGTKEMRPGMSAGVEILIDQIPDTLYVPIQAVYPHKGKTISFVPNGAGGARQVEVKVGQSNDREVEILSGLKEGQVVLLSPPAGFNFEAAPRPERPGMGKGVPGKGMTAGNRPPGGGKPPAGGGAGRRARPAAAGKAPVGSQ